MNVCTMARFPHHRLATQGESSSAGRPSAYAWPRNGNREARAALGRSSSPVGRATRVPLQLRRASESARRRARLQIRSSPERGSAESLVVWLEIYALRSQHAHHERPLRELRVGAVMSAFPIGVLADESGIGSECITKGK